MNIIIFVAFFHLFPVVIFLASSKKLQKNNQTIFITALLIISFLSDLIGLKFALLGCNTNLISNWYLIVARIIETTILIIPLSISKSKRIFLIQAVALTTIYHIGYSLWFGFAKQSDYLNIFSNIFTCTLAFFAIYTLLSNSNSNKSTIVISIIPALAILVYTTAMFIPQMITNIDDDFEFPTIFQQIRFWAAFGSNIIRDSLFAIFFFQAKQMNYDTGK